MTDFTQLNLARDVENMAPKFGMPEGMEARFARRPLGLEKSGVSLFRLPPETRLPFGHRHGEQEEVYVVVEGSARVKVDDEVLELKEWDAIRLPPKTWRCLEGGPEGAVVLAYGAGPAGDTEMEPNWWAQD